MKRELLSQALNEIEDRHIRDTLFFDPTAMQASPERNRPMKPKRIFTLLLAAALLLSLGLAAYAIGSVHAQRQRELREDLQIAQSGTDSYVEYAVPDGQTPGAVLLSTINDGQEQRVYVDVSPVTEEELVGFPGTLSFGWSIVGDELWGMAMPQLRVDRSLSGYEALHAAVLEDAYDAETQTLTLVCYLMDSRLREIMAQRGEDSVQLELKMAEGEREVRVFGPVTLTPTREERRVFDFHRALYTDPESGAEVVLLDLTLTPVSAVWRIHYEGDAEQHRPNSALPPEEQARWNRVEDEICIDAQLLFADGSSFSTGGALTCPYADGAVSLNCGWGAAIDINAVERIVLHDQVLWEKE